MSPQMEAFLNSLTPELKTLATKYTEGVFDLVIEQGDGWAVKTLLECELAAIKNGTQIR